MPLRITDEHPKRKRLRWPGHDYGGPGHAYHLTICARPETHPFRDRKLAEQAVTTLMVLQDLSGVKVLAYCFMPDHLHVVCWAADGADRIPSFVRRFKSFMSRVGRDFAHPGVLWQRSYYDHVIRKSEDVRQICAYVTANPVRKGLVQEVDEYPFARVLDMP